jgi:hypothetical protein
MKMIFKSPFRFGKQQIVAVFIFSFGSIAAIIQLSIQYFNKVDTGIFPLFVISGLFILSIWLYPSYIIRWFKDYYTVELYDDKLVGYNLFNRKGEFRFDSIKEIKRNRSLFMRGYEILYCDNNDKKHSINTGIDYAGFIDDFILQRCNKTTLIDYNWIRKCREDARGWSYTRCTPFTTKYEEGYLEWLEPIVNIQKDMLIARGELKHGVLYGNNIKELLWEKKER